MQQTVDADVTKETALETTLVYGSSYYYSAVVMALVETTDAAEEMTAV